uniref:Putative secreted protein n=1 Tax=Ixodes ricinus TaxID=34613 RepID=A0A090X9C7_IXORI
MCPHNNNRQVFPFSAWLVKFFAIVPRVAIAWLFEDPLRQRLTNVYPKRTKDTLLATLFRKLGGIIVCLSRVCEQRCSKQFSQTRQKHSVASFDTPAFANTESVARSPATTASRVGQTLAKFSCRHDKHSSLANTRYTSVLPLWQMPMRGASMQYPLKTHLRRLQDRPLLVYLRSFCFLDFLPPDDCFLLTLEIPLVLGPIGIWGSCFGTDPPLRATWFLLFSSRFFCRLRSFSSTALLKAVASSSKAKLRPA